MVNKNPNTPQVVKYKKYESEFNTYNVIYVTRLKQVVKK